MGTSDRVRDQKRAFDWDGVRGRIAAVSTAMEGMESSDPETAERIWAQRTAQLARPTEHEEKGGQTDPISSIVNPYCGGKNVPVKSNAQV